MSDMDQETVRKVANLSRIEISEAEQAQVAPKLAGILKWVDMLSEVDTDDVEPLANVVNIPLKLREDIVNDGDVQAKVLANAPEDTQGFYVVPKVVDQEG